MMERTDLITDLLIEIPTMHASSITVNTGGRIIGVYLQYSTDNSFWTLITGRLHVIGGG